MCVILQITNIGPVPFPPALDKHRPGSLLDLHSWNHFNGRAGYANCLNLYLEHTPYLDSLWIGEGRNYNEPPDHWMVEVSGIPLGLFGEMLQCGGKPSESTGTPAPPKGWPVPSDGYLEHSWVCRKTGAGLLVTGR